MARKRRKKMKAEKIPPGFKLLHTLRGHETRINKIKWSPDGLILAASYLDGTIHLWDPNIGESLHTSKRLFQNSMGMDWSPDGQIISYGSRDNSSIELWDVKTRASRGILGGQEDQVDGVFCMAWSPDGRMLATGSVLGTLRIWNTVTRKLLKKMRVGYSCHSVSWKSDGKRLAGAFGDTVCVWEIDSWEKVLTLGRHSAQIYRVIWSPDGETLVSCSMDRTISLWGMEKPPIIGVIESHTSSVYSVSFSPDGSLLASKSGDNTVRLWRCDSWELVSVLDEPTAELWSTNLEFHPTEQVLATLGEEDTVIRIWELDYDALLGAAPVTASVHYTNAKTVLVGDTGVGKTGLGLVLTGHPYEKTDSTHGRNVWTFGSEEVKLDKGRHETRETLLWDLAGQAGYRLIHQLSLNEVAVALVVFDARSETDPFSGVKYWDRALRQALRAQGDSAAPMKKVLVGARTDRGAIGVSPARIQSMVRELGFDGYFETSAKEGWKISELAEAIRGSIEWNTLPKVSSTELFQNIKSFLVEEKKAGRLLSTADNLYRSFLKTNDAPKETENLPSQFETCIGRVESRDLIRRLNFGDLVLLQPEFLDAYASAMVNAAKAEPDGMGCITEEDALAGRFKMSKDERIKYKEHERLLLIATVEELLRHEIALREQTPTGAILIFPSQFTREWPEAPDPEGKAVIFEFEGSVINIYTTLAVRLSRSDIFEKDKMWKNAAIFKAKVGGSCGIWLREIEEGHGELTLFFDKAASRETCFQLEEFVRTHLERRAVVDTIQRRRIFTCVECETPVTDVQARKRRERGFDWMKCSVCDARVTLLDREELLVAVPESTVPEMDQAADVARKLDTAASILKGKIATGDFDVFLCHNSEDKPAVKQIGNKLKEHGILPWFDEWELRPGLPWQKTLEKQIKKIKSAAVFVGKKGIGPWQDLELDAFLRQFIKRKCPVIPVILKTSKKKPKLPIFLEAMTWVDFRKKKPDPMEQLIWGITGERGTRGLSR